MDGRVISDAFAITQPWWRVRSSGRRFVWRRSRRTI